MFLVMRKKSLWYLKERWRYFSRKRFPPFKSIVTPPRLNFSKKNLGGGDLEGNTTFLSHAFNKNCCN